MRLPGIVRGGPGRIRVGSIAARLGATVLAACLLAWAAPQGARAGSPAAPRPSEVLATVGPSQVTADDLQLALGSSPFTTQFNAMDEDDQAGLRGDMLRRLVAARMLALEARRIGLDLSPSYQRDLESFRLGLLFRRYNEGLRGAAAIPADTLGAMKEQFAHDPDGLNAAKAAWVADRYRVLKKAALQDLLQQERARIHEERIAAGIAPDAVLMEGRGFAVRYADLVDAAQHPSAPDSDWVRQRLYERAELLLFARAAEREGADVSQELARYEAEHLPALMIDFKVRQWVPDDAVLRGWLREHPDTALVPERRHVGQLVVATRAEALALRGRILSGESLFALAGQYSIDPAGRAQNGDMGWIAQRRGAPELDRALAGLPDGRISEVVQTPMGFHLLVVLERRKESRKSFEEIRDRVRQLVIDEDLRGYLGELERRYPVSWKILPSGTAGAAPQPPVQPQPTL